MNEKKEKLCSLMRSCCNCGKCLTQCPVYKEKKQEKYSFRGKLNLLKEILEGKLPWSWELIKLFDECLLCGRCQNICSSGIQTSEILTSVREWMIPLFLKDKSLISEGKIQDGIKTLSEVMKKNDFLLGLGGRFSEELFHKNLKNAVSQEPLRIPDSDKKKRLWIFPGCVFSHLRPEVLNDLFWLAENFQYNPVLLPQTQCCGLPYLSRGLKGMFLKTQEENLKQIHFNVKSGDSVLFPCTSCLYCFQEKYSFSQGISVLEWMQNNSEKLPEGFSPEFQYHYSCHEQNLISLKKAIEFFQKSHWKIKLSTDCCGFGGSFSFLHPEMSEKIYSRKIENCSEELITSCSGCYLQFLTHDLNNGITHISTLLRKLLEGKV